MTRHPARLAMALLLTSLMAACAGPRALQHRTSLVTEAGAFTFEFAPVDEVWAQKVKRAVDAAGPQLAQWGGLEEPVHVRIFPSHESLARAVGRRGYTWLRAWARYDDVLIQSPRTWSLFGAPQADVDELILHELTHAVMYQQASDRTHWRRRHIPLWFREGMASWTARQGHRWPTLEDLARFAERNPTLDLLDGNEALYRDQSDSVYAAAHHAFSFLVRRYGQEGIRAVLQGMKAGRDFDAAFEHALGLTPARFTEDFRRFVRLRGFRDGRRRFKAPQAAGVPTLFGTDWHRFTARMKSCASSGAARKPIACSACARGRSVSGVLPATSSFPAGLRRPS